MLKGVQVNLSILKGKISSTDKEEAVQALVEFKNDNGETIAKTIADEDGNYFVTLSGNQKYTLSITADGFDNLNKEVTLPLGKNTTHIQVENFTMTPVVGQ